MDFIIECSLATRTNLRNRIARWQSIVLMKCTNDHCVFVVSITMQCIYWDVQCRRRSTSPSPPTQPHRQRSQIECKWRHNKNLFFVLMLSTSRPLGAPAPRLSLHFSFSSFAHLHRITATTSDNFVCVTWTIVCERACVTRFIFIRLCGVTKFPKRFAFVLHFPFFAFLLLSSIRPFVENLFSVISSTGHANIRT